MSEDDPVERQVQACNRRDLEGFLECYPDEACIRDGQGKVLLEGHAYIRARYAALFRSRPKLHASVEGRLRAGEWTVDEERVVLHGLPAHFLLAYRLEGGLIHDVVMRRSDSM